MSTTELDPIDRRPATLAVACLIGIGTAIVVLAVGPWVTLGTLLFGGLTYGVFGIPIIGLAHRFLWVQSYSERTADPITD